MRTNKHHNENQYLLKFNDRYFVTKDECGMYLIIGRHGQIEPTEKSGILECWGCNKINMPAGISKRKIRKMIKALSSVTIKIVRLSGEFLIQFNEKNIDFVCSVIKARNRISYTNIRRKPQPIVNVIVNSI